MEFEKTIDLALKASLLLGRSKSAIEETIKHLDGKSFHSKEALRESLKDVLMAIYMFEYELERD